MRELLSSKISIDFLGKSALCAVLSVALVTASLFVWFNTGDAKYGTDFSGGHELLLKFTGNIEPEQVRVALSEGGEPDARVQNFQGESQEISIRLQSSETTEILRQKIDKALSLKFADQYQVLKSDFVGPTVGAELREKALIAVALSILSILIYVAFRFEFAVGVGTVVALAHDVIISTGIYLISGHTISMATLAAALTIVGYSVNDTVVVFDRVREERSKRPSADIGQIVNESLCFTLSRTVITHVLTLFSALALFIFGSGEIKDLSLYLVAGIVLGAYSTIFVVAPIAVLWERRRNSAQQLTVASQNL